MAVLVSHRYRCCLFIPSEAVDGQHDAEEQEDGNNDGRHEACVVTFCRTYYGKQRGKKLQIWRQILNFAPKISLKVCEAVSTMFQWAQRGILTTVSFLLLINHFSLIYLKGQNFGNEVEMNEKKSLSQIIYQIISPLFQLLTQKSER